MSDVKPVLWNKKQAMANMGEMPERTFLELFGPMARRMGNRDYWRPSDLDDMVLTIPMKGNG